MDFHYLAPGGYPVDLVAPDGVTVEMDIPLPLDVSIESGGTGEAEIVIMSAVAE